MDTLFGFLATKFAASPENIAIEALTYILDRSPPARDAFADLLAGGEITLPNDISFTSQVAGDDQARPDIVGMSDTLGSVIIIENKFWDGLTDNQPVTYYQRLPNDANAVLAFIVPSSRMSSLWTELSNRFAGADILLGERQTPMPENWSAQFADGRRFVLTSWRHVLDRLVIALTSAGDERTLDDARQLMGLCERMDTRWAKNTSRVGGSLKDVQDLAGHVSLATTQRYIQSDTAAKRKLVDCG